jgi:hypothetical protein
MMRIRPGMRVTAKNPTTNATKMRTTSTHKTNTQMTKSQKTSLDKVVLDKKHKNYDLNLKTTPGNVNDGALNKSPKLTKFKNNSEKYEKA